MRLRTSVMVLLVWAVLLLPAATAAVGAPAKVLVKAEIMPLSAPARRGSHALTTLVLTPPEGIKINRYPPITLKLTAPKGITLDAAEIKQGSSEPIEDPDDFPFKTIEPMKIGFKVEPGAALGKTSVKGKVNFVYCVAKSGYCERTTQDVGFDVTVAPARTN